MHKLVPNYHQDPPPPRRRRWFRLAMVVGGCVILLAASFWLRDVAIEFYWNQKAMRYREDPTRVVYEDDPRAAMELIAKSNQYRIPWIRDSRGLRDRNWQLPVAYHPEIGDKSLGPLPYLLLHGRNAGSQQRLVAVWLQMDEISDSERILLISAVSLSPSRGDPVTGKEANGTGGFFVRSRRDDHLMIFAGQPKEGDGSRFDIRFELNKAPGKLTGQLQSSGEVRISLEEGQLEILMTREELEGTKK
jgi:hypothetical protein